VVLVNVHAGNGELAIKLLKKKMQRELIFRLMKESRYYEPPSRKRVRKLQETERRIRKLARKQMMEG
jgi:small subunit ribosomal protein S21